MTFTYGKNIRLSLFGESHGPAIGVSLDGLPAGMSVSEASIKRALDLRRPAGDISTARRESDLPEILSGVFEGKTDGGALTILIRNGDVRSSDYSPRLFRPSHADYTAFVKLGGFGDYRGGGTFSGRMTAPIAAAGAVLIDGLREKGIYIGTHIARCGDICDRELSEDPAMLEAELKALSEKSFAVLDEAAGEDMKSLIAEAREAGDSVGGILETAVAGVPAGLGSPFFDSLESVISHLVFSVPGVKGIEFGLGFGFGYLRGSEVNDQLDIKDGKIVTETNFSGGINGGISNGMPILFRTAMRPTPSISAPQQTADIEAMETRELRLSGRHDPAIFHRARVVIDSVTAIGLFDLMLERGRDLWKTVL